MAFKNDKPPEERVGYQGRCNAKKRNGDGKRCMKPSGFGTEHVGYGTSKYHGGNTAIHKKNAIAMEAKQQMLRMGEPMDIQPRDALVGVLQATAGHVNWLYSQIRHLEDLSTREARILMSMYDQERDRLTRVAKAASEAGLEEHYIKMHVAVGSLFIKHLMRIVDLAESEYGLDPAARVAIGKAAGDIGNAGQVGGVDVEKLPGREGLFGYPESVKIPHNKVEIDENVAA